MVTFIETKPMNDGSFYVEVFCLSSDTKPSTYNGKPISNGSVCIEQNGSTGAVGVYFRNASNWKKVDNSGG